MLNTRLGRGPAADAVHEHERLVIAIRIHGVEVARAKAVVERHGRDLRFVDDASAFGAVQQHTSVLGGLLELRVAGRRAKQLVTSLLARHGPQAGAAPAPAGADTGAAAAARAAVVRVATAGQRRASDNQP